jgi:hypothetical protein
MDCSSARTKDPGEWLEPQRMNAARVWVLLARAAPVGVVFRRGPAKQVQLIKWNLDNDTFKCGQWLKAKVDLSLSDLSPNGKLLVYFAMRYCSRIPSWTAISKPPYFTALAFLPVAKINGGGGQFLSNGTIQLNHSSNAKVAIGRRLGSLTVVGDITFSKRPQSLDMLERDGWIRKRLGKFQPTFKRSACWTRQPVELCRKPHPTEEVTLEMESQHLCAGVGRCGNRYRVVDHGNEPLFEALADWGDWDAEGDFLFSRNGKLFRSKLTSKGLREPKELADFNANQFAELAPPQWASRW